MASSRLNRKHHGGLVVTRNSCNFSTGAANDTLVMTDASTMAFRGRSQSSVSRTLNTIYQISATRNASVTYSVDVSCSLTLSGGETGTVFLEMATNAGFTLGVQELSRFVNGNTGTLTIGLNITQNCTGGLNGFIPAGNYVRLRTANTVGSPIFTYRTGQEIIL